MKDGTILDTGSKMRYVAFRVTMYTSFSVHGNNSALNTVVWAREHWKQNGFKYVVLDTWHGDIIAVYPIDKAAAYFERPTDRQYEEVDA